MSSLDAEFLFRASWVLTAVLFAFLAAFTLFLIALKWLRSLWRDHKKKRCAVFNRNVYEYLDNDARKSAEPFLRNLNFLDRRILKESLLTFSETFGGDWGEKLCELFEELGFVKEEVQRTRGLSKSSRRTAAKRLGKMKSKTSIPALNRLLTDRSASVRMAGAKALGEIGAFEFLEEIIESLAGLSKIAAIELAVLVAKAGAASVPSLLKLCAHRDPDVRLFSIELLGIVADPRAKDTLLHLYKVGNLETRTACLKAFQRHSLDQDIDVFLSRMASPVIPWEEAAQIAKLMGNLKCAKAIPLLKARLSHSNWWVRKNSGEALSKMGKDGEAALAQVLELPDAFAREMAGEWLDEIR